MNFNSSDPTRMHVDINSCFATIEQQANPHLRGKPIVVAAYATGKGCVLASSIEAKKLGIKTGMNVGDAKTIYPTLKVLTPDPPKYRNVHLKLRKLLSEYSDKTYAGSIDEFNLDLKDYPVLRSSSALEVGEKIKKRIKKEIGDWITTSVGIAPNKYLAKIAANLQKPDGLNQINKDNFEKVYKNLGLTDLTGIKSRNQARLNSVGIFSVFDLYQSPVWKIKAAFHSITGFYWHLRLSGYEIDDNEFARRSYGNSVALGVNLKSKEEIAPILSNLLEKSASRMRAAGYSARGVHLSLFYKDGSFWHKGMTIPHPVFDTRDLFRIALKLLLLSPTAVLGQVPVRNIAVTCFDITKNQPLQMGFFEDMVKKESLVKAVDKINNSWGDFTVKSAKILLAKQQVLDRIAFGAVKEIR